MNNERFEQFKRAYREGLEEAVTANPESYVSQGATPAEFAEVVSTRMMANISSGKHMMNNYDSPGFRRACRKVGIKGTRKAIFEFLEIAT